MNLICLVKSGENICLNIKLFYFFCKEWVICYINIKYFFYSNIMEGYFDDIFNLYFIGVGECIIEFFGIEWVDFFEKNIILVCEDCDV